MFRNILNSKLSSTNPGSRRARRNFRAFPWAAASHKPDLWFMPTLSVVVPVYNHASFLADCLESIIENSPIGTEIVLVNDGSTDHFNKVVEPFLKLEQISLIEQENLGISAALNRGISAASGTLLTWQSADNIVKNQGYTRLVHFIAANPAVEVAYGNIDLIDEQGKPFKDANFRPQDQEYPGSEVLALPYTGNLLSQYADNFLCSAFMFRTATVRATRGFLASLLGAEDYGVALELARYGHVAHLDSDVALISYRLHSNSLTENLGSRAIRDQTIKLIEEEQSFKAAKKLSKTSEIDPNHQHYSKAQLAAFGINYSKICVSSSGLLSSKYLNAENLLEVPPEGSCPNSKSYLVERFFFPKKATSQQPDDKKARTEFLHFPAINCPEFLRRARDSHFRAVEHGEVGSKILVRASQKLFTDATGPDLNDFMRASKRDFLSREQNNFEFHFLCFSDLEVKLAKEYCQKYKIASNILDLSLEYHTGIFELTQALVFVLSSVDVYLTPSGIDSWEDFLEFRVEAALTALAAIPIVSLSFLKGSAKESTLSTSSPFDCENPLQLSHLIDFPHLVNPKLGLDKFNFVIDSLELGSFEQWIEKHSVEGCKKRLETFILSRELDGSSRPKVVNL